MRRDLRAAAAEPGAQRRTGERHTPAMVADQDSAPDTAMGMDDAIASLEPRYRPLADALMADWQRNPRVVRVALGGSLGSRQADVYSDLDFAVALADDAACDELVAALPGAVGAAYSAVLGAGRARVFTAVTGEWLRVDVVAEPIEVAAGRPRSPEIVLLDRSGPEIEFRAAPARGASPDLRATAESFLRIVGLLPVSVGRHEGYVGMKGIMLLRDHLVDLFAIENGGAPIGGVKRLNPMLTAEQRRLLESQPPLVAEPRSIIECSIAVADAFLPRARALAESRGDEWPAAFEAATRAHLRASMDIELAGGSGTIQP